MESSCRALVALVGQDLSEETMVGVRPISLPGCWQEPGTASWTLGTHRVPQNG